MLRNPLRTSLALAAAASLALSIPAAAQAARAGYIAQLNKDEPAIVYLQHALIEDGDVTTLRWADSGRGDWAAAAGIGYVHPEDGEEGGPSLDLAVSRIIAGELGVPIEKVAVEAHLGVSAARLGGNWVLESPVAVALVRENPLPVGGGHIVHHISLDLGARLRYGEVATTLRPAIGLGNRVLVDDGSLQGWAVQTRVGITRMTSWTFEFGLARLLLPTGNP